MKIFNIPNTIILLFINIIIALKQWKNDYAGSKDYSFLDIDVIDSIAIDNNTNTELILGNVSGTSESYFYLIQENKTTPDIINNTLLVSNIESPLMIFNSVFYFCSPSYNKVLFINGTILGEVNNSKTNSESLQNAPGLKCFGMDKYIAVMYYDTESLYALDPTNNEYEITYTDKEGKFSFKAINIIEKTVSSISFILLRLGEKNINVTKINFLGTSFKTEKNGIFPKDLTFYSKSEIMAIGQEAAVFSYEPNQIGNCILYILDYGDPVKYYINLFSSFVNVLKESAIHTAAFIENTKLLYYSINKNNREYFGVIDTFNLLEIYNTEKKGEGKIFTDYGYLNQNLLYLNYFDGKNKKRYCPFVSTDDSCTYNIKYNNFFAINKVNVSIYSNSFSDCINGKKIANFYCLDSCTFGYEDKGDECNLCIKGDFNNKKYYSLKNRNCDDLDKIEEKCPLNNKGNICLDCEGEKSKIYEYECIESCDKVFGEEGDNNICNACKDIDAYYYKKKDTDEIGKCIKFCPGKIYYEYNICEKCTDLEPPKVYFRLKNICIEKCPKYFIKHEDECKLCQNINEKEIYYEDISEDKSNISCVKECLNETHTKYSERINKSEDFNFTEEIEVFHCNKCDQYIQKDICVGSCGDRYLERLSPYKHCEYCNESNMFMKKELLCYQGDICPKYIQKVGNNSCQYCGPNLYFTDNNCVKNCSEYELGEEEGITKINDDYKTIKICKKCENNTSLINGKCKEKCFNNSYKNKNNFCKKCLCINKDNENNDNIENKICDPLDTEYYRCNCLKNHSYGYNCEFLSEANINEHNMIIISLYYKYGLYRLIQSKKNYFTYKIKGKTIDEKKYIFNWKLYLEKEEEITNNKKYEKYFATNTNEPIFGVNKELFDFAINKNKDLLLSLSIDSLNSNSNDSYSHEIKIRLVNYESINKNLFDLKHIGEELNYEMKTIYSLSNKTNFRINEMQYYFQYEFLDYYDERIPITPYLELENINFYSPFLKGFYINVKNDRDIVTSTLLDLNEFTSFLNDSIKEINSNKDFSQIEKIYALKSNLRGKKQDLISNKEDLKIINDILIQNLELSINKNGYYIENNNTNNANDDEIGKDNRYIITYSEPKLLFSLINDFLISQKDKLNNETDYNIFFNYFNITFEKVFNNNTLSNKTLSESDIKSLFRTLDNFYDALIGSTNNKKIIEQYYHNYIQILDNFCKYLTYITYPSETIRLIGKRISLISYHLGNHQENNISFPFIDNMDNITLNSFLNYSYDNFYLNENICSQGNSTFFCMIENDFTKLRDSISKNNNYNLDNISINVYLLQDITKKNEEKIEADSKGHSQSETIEYNILFKNYNVIFKIIDKDNGIIALDNKDIYYDAEFQYERQLDENDKINENIGFIDEDYLQSENLNIHFYPNNANITCAPKNNNNKYKNYLCKTHFNYDEKKVRCKCNLIDEITVIDNHEIAEYYKSKQFPQQKYEFINQYSSKIMLIIILLLLIPSLIILIKDIINDSKYITNNQNLDKELQDERKKNYMKIKKYYNVGTLRFSLYLTLKKFPYFTIFNNYKLSYPRYIIHLVTLIGILIGFIIPLIPFYKIPFLERQIFIDQRDIKYNDYFITDEGPSKYKQYFFYFGFAGLLLSRIFIYILYIILGYYEEENDIWLKIKTICKDYVYYEIKSEVLLGTSWNKIKLRIISFYYICGNYILRKKVKKDNNIQKYLNYISRNVEERNTINEIGSILPRGTRNSSFKKSNSNDINLITNNNNKALEMNEKNQLLIEEDDDDDENIFKKKSINDKKRMLTFHINKRNNKNYFENSKICKTDNFTLDNTFKNDKSKRVIERFEKIRNKYIYKLKRNVINEIDGDGDIINLNEEKKHLYISPQINYSINQFESFNTLKGSSHKEKESKNKINKFIFISFVLWILLTALCILAIFLIKTILNKFGKFIIKAWIRPLLVVIIAINFILYYLQILIGSILLFCFYHLRKKKCFCRFLFWIFVDKTMIHIYKIRNLITKYKKEFDYL